MEAVYKQLPGTRRSCLQVASRNLWKLFEVATRNP